MAEYRIVCADLQHPQRHIVRVGTAPASNRPTKMWSTEEVRHALAARAFFYTTSPSTRKRAAVFADTCRIPGCSVRTLRSAADAVRDNNLDNMRPR